MLTRNVSSEHTEKSWLWESSWLADPVHDGSLSPFGRVNGTGKLAVRRGHCRWAVEDCGPPGVEFVGSSSFLAVARDVLGVSSFSKDEILCTNHIHAFGDPEIASYASEAVYASLSTELQDRGAFKVWRHAATVVIPGGGPAAESPRVEQHIARKNRGRGVIVVRLMSPHPLTLKIPFPWDLIKFRPSKSSDVLSFLQNDTFVFDNITQRTVFLAFDAKLLPARMWPQDPFRGFILEPARALHNSKTVAIAPRVLLQLPEPDFAMPFNVVTLQSTLLAFFIGSIMAGLVRRSAGPSSTRYWID